MGVLSHDLKNLGYSRTEKESPFDEDGTLWTKGYELVCDETAIVISKDTARKREKRDSDDNVYTYQNSDNVKMIGGYIGSYNWGEDDGEFLYDGDW